MCNYEGGFRPVADKGTILQISIWNWNLFMITAFIKDRKSNSHVSRPNNKYNKF